MNDRLVLLDHENDDEEIQRRLHLARARRVESYSIDRSRFATIPLQPWCVEAEEGEGKWKPIRNDATKADQIAAWRGLFNLPIPPNHRQKP